MRGATTAIGVVQTPEAEAERWRIALLAGHRRIGRTPIARLKWLLRFADPAEPSRLEQLNETKLADLDAEVSAFIGPVAPRAGSGARPQAIKRDELIDVAHRFRRGIGFLMAGREWSFPLNELGCSVDRDSKHHFKKDYYSADWHSAFIMRATDLVVEQGSRIRQCSRKGCPRLFVRRKGGLYCSRSCSQKQRTERMKRALERAGKDWSERRHSYYVRKMQGLYGRDVKVGRREPKGK